MVWSVEGGAMQPPPVDGMGVKESDAADEPEKASKAALASGLLGRPPWPGSSGRPPCGYRLHRPPRGEGIPLWRGSRNLEPGSYMVQVPGPAFTIEFLLSGKREVALQGGEADATMAPVHDSQEAPSNEP